MSKHNNNKRVHLVRVNENANSEVESSRRSDGFDDDALATELI